MNRLGAVVPCKDEADRIGATLAGLRQVVGTGPIVVVDDGSTDNTAALAEAAGARVVRHGVNRGKAAALESGVDALLAGEGGRDCAAILFVDGDLEGSAANLSVLADPVLAGDADMAIATLPAQKQAGGGRGRVVRLARAGIRRLTGREMLQPLSGMRALTPAAFEAARPLPPRWGVEVGLTVAILQAGMRVIEVPCELQHRVSGKDWRGVLHRAAQFRDVWLTLNAPRRRPASGRPR